MRKQKRADLFLKVVMTLLLTVGFLFFGGLVLAAVAWGFVNLGAVMLPIAFLVVVAVLAAWAVANSLLR